MLLLLSVVCGWDAGAWFEASAHPAASQATKHLSAKIQEAPDDALLHVERARQWRLQGLKDRARSDLKIALRRQPHLAAAHHEWALLDLATGNNARALRRFSTAIHAAPTWWRPRRQRGALLLRRGKVAEAVEDLRVVLAQRESPDDFAALADALWELERGEEAAALLLEGATTKGSAVLAVRAMEAYRALGWYAEAMRALDLAERLGTDPYSAAVAAVQLGIQMGGWDWAFGEASRRGEALQRSSNQRATAHRQAQLALLNALRDEARQLGALNPQDHDARACLPKSSIEISLSRKNRPLP
jgi:tetratricopeptide (TPR) repeat protein